MMRFLRNMRWLARRLIRQWAWIIRFVFGIFVLTQISPAAPIVNTDVQYTVITQQSHVCVHTRLIDEVESWKIQQTLQLVREMGANHIVEFFPWAYVEYERGHYDWASVDRIVNHTSSQGIRVIARMGLVPQWAQEGVQRPTLNTLPVESYPAFAAFVAAFAERYADTISDIIIWNEPNLAFEWGYQQVDAAAYVDLLKAVYQPVHRVNPDVRIFLAGLAPTLEPPGSPNGLDDLIYLEQVYEAGGKPYFDGVALHTYGFTHPASHPPAADTLNFRRAELLHEIMARYGDAEKPVHITETGWNDAPHWDLAVSPAQRARYTIDALDLAKTWPWLDQMCLWMFRTPAPTNSHQDGYTMVTPEFRLKAIYYAIQAYTQDNTEDQPLWITPPQDSG